MGYALGKERLEFWQGFTKQTLRESPSDPEGARQISALLEQMEPRIIIVLVNDYGAGISTCTKGK